MNWKLEELYEEKNKETEIIPCEKHWGQGNLYIRKILIEVDDQMI